MWLLLLLLSLMVGGEARLSGSAGWERGNRGGNRQDLSLRPTWEPSDIHQPTENTQGEKGKHYPSDASRFFAIPDGMHHRQKQKRNKHKHRNGHRRITMNQNLFADGSDENRDSDLPSRSHHKRDQPTKNKDAYHQRMTYDDGFAVLSPVGKRKDRPSAAEQRSMYRFGSPIKEYHLQTDPPQTRLQDNRNNSHFDNPKPSHQLPLSSNDESVQPTYKENINIARENKGHNHEEKRGLYDLDMMNDGRFQNENLHKHIGHISKRASTQASAERAEDQMPHPEGTPEAKFNPDGTPPVDQLVRNFSLDSRLAYRSPAMYIDDSHLSMLRASEKPKEQENNQSKGENPDNKEDTILVTPSAIDHTVQHSVLGHTTMITSPAKLAEADLQPTAGISEDTFELSEILSDHENTKIVPNPEEGIELSGNSKQSEIEMIETLPEFLPVEKTSSGEVDEILDTREESEVRNSEILTQNHPPHNDYLDKPIAEAHDTDIDSAKPSLDYDDPELSSPGQEVKEFVANSRMYAIPEPDWLEAKRTLGAAWPLHIYGAGVAFILLSLYSLISLLRLCQHKNLLSQGYFLSMNIMMVFLGFFRATYFLVDGYNTKATFHPVGAYFLLNIAYPCLLSSFSIIFLALLQSTRTFVLSPKLQNSKYLVLVIATHFAFCTLTDLIVGLVLKAKAMMFVSQLVTVIWGVLLFAGYISVFTKLHMATVWRQKEMMRHILAKIKVNMIAPITMQPRLTLSLAINVMLVGAILGLMLMAWLIYGMASINGVFYARVPTPWAWWGYTFGLRVLEILLCIIISYVGTQPFRYNQPTNEKSWHWLGMFYLAPCQHIFCGDDKALDINDEELDWCDLPGDNMGSPGHMNNMTGAINQVIINPEEGVPFNQQGLPLTAYGNTIQSIKSDSLKRPASRPASLLINDNGFVRFRQDGEEGGDLCLSTDDELDGPDVPRTTPNEIKQCAIVHTPSNPEPPDIKSKPLDDYPPGSLTDIEEYYAYPKSLPLKRKRRRRRSTLLSGSPPGTPASFLSATDCDGVSMWSFRPPSSIHLKDSIENVLNYRGIDIRTPDYLESPIGSQSRVTRDRLNKSLHSLGSMSELQSLRDYFIRRFLTSHPQPQEIADLTKSYDFDDFSIDPIAEDSDAASLKSAQSHYARSSCDLHVDTETKRPKLSLMRGHLKVKPQDDDVPFTLEDVCP